jgi:hypothetical protein
MTISHKRHPFKTDRFVYIYLSCHNHLVLGSTSISVEGWKSPYAQLLLVNAIQSYLARGVKATRLALDSPLVYLACAKRQADITKSVAG